MAVFALGAFVASSALASQEALWLINGNEVTSSQPSVTEGELLLEDTNPPIGSPADILCSGRFIGTIGPNGTDTITLVEGLSGEDNDLICTFDEKGACSGTTVLVLAINLPWQTELMLTAGGRFVDLLFTTAAGSEPGYEVECSTIIGNLKDRCENAEGKEASSEELNIAGDVEGKFLETETEGISPAGNCSLGGTGAGLVVGTSLVTSTSGTVTVSEP